MIYVRRYWIILQFFFDGKITISVCNMERNNFFIGPFLFPHTYSESNNITKTFFGFLHISVRIWVKWKAKTRTLVHRRKNLVKWLVLFPYDISKAFSHIHTWKSLIRSYMKIPSLYIRIQSNITLRYSPKSIRKWMVKNEFAGEFLFLFCKRTEKNIVTVIAVFVLFYCLQKTN